MRHPHATAVLVEWPQGLVESLLRPLWLVGIGILMVLLRLLLARMGIPAWRSPSRCSRSSTRSGTEGAGLTTPWPIRTLMFDMPLAHVSRNGDGS